MIICVQLLQEDNFFEELWYGVGDRYTSSDVVCLPGFITIIFFNENGGCAHQKDFLKVSLDWLFLLVP